MFITFEGGEGTGKSTQVQLLLRKLSENGIVSIATREPGGTPQGEALRNLLVNGDIASWTPVGEALLNYAARQEHLERFIRPALIDRKTVVCDRFMDSTRAYQQYAGGCGASLIDSLESTIVGATRPDLTFVFDLDPIVGLQRAKGRGSPAEDRFERKGLDFHRKLRAGFMQIARGDPKRCRIVDASQPVNDVFTAIWQDVEVFFHARRQ